MTAGAGSGKFIGSLTPDRRGARLALVTALVCGLVAVAVAPSAAGSSRRLPCKLHLSARSDTLEFTGGAGAFSYTVPDYCRVEATSSAQWLTLVQEQGAVAFTAAGPVAGGRSAKITVSATDPATARTERKVFTVVQRGREGMRNPAGGGAAVIDTATKSARATAGLILLGNSLDELALVAGATGRYLNTGDLAAGTSCAEDAVAKVVRDASAGGSGAGPRSCPDGGTVAVVRGKASLAVDFSDCRIAGDAADGSPYALALTGRLALKGSFSEETGAFRGEIAAGDERAVFVEKRYVDRTFAVVADRRDIRMRLHVARYEGDDFFDAVCDGTADRTFVTAEGGARLLLDARKLSLSYRRAGSTADFHAAGRLRATSYTGDRLETSTSFALKDVSADSAGDGVTTSIAVNGKVGMSSYPAGTCGDGTVTVETDVPLLLSGATVVQGHVVLNGIAATVAAGKMSLDTAPAATAEVAAWGGM